MTYLCTLSKSDWNTKREAKVDHRMFVCYILVNGKKAIGVFAHSNKYGDISVDKQKGVYMQWNADFAAYLDDLIGEHLYNSHGICYDIYFHGCCDGYKTPITGGRRNITIRPMSDIRESTCTFANNERVIKLHHSDGRITTPTVVDMYAKEFAD